MTSKIEKFDSGMHYIKIPSDFDVSELKSGPRVLCTINSSLTIHCALIYRKAQGHLVYIGIKILKKLNIKNGDEIHFELEEDHSEFQFNYPEELKEVLRTDKEAKAKFDSLTDGNKRGLISLVNRVKSTDKKIERSLKIAEKLKYGITSPQRIMKN